jgi:hypothetical protein
VGTWSIATWHAEHIWRWRFHSTLPRCERLRERDRCARPHRPPDTLGGTGRHIHDEPACRQRRRIQRFVEAITLTFPGPCSGPPLTPINFPGVQRWLDRQRAMGPGSHRPGASRVCLECQRVLRRERADDKPGRERDRAAGIVRAECRRDKRLRRECGHSDSVCRRALTTGTTRLMRRETYTADRLGAPSVRGYLGYLDST